MIYWLLGVLSLLIWGLWKLLAIGCEEPLVNQRKEQWWKQ